MAGRKPGIPPDVVISAVLKFKNEVVWIDKNGEKKIVVASNRIGHNISVYLNGVISKNAIHLFVHRDRHNVKAALGFQKEQTPNLVHNFPNNVYMDSFNERGESNLIDESSDCSSDDTLTKLPTKCFTFTFSNDEWKQIEPKEVVYKLNDRMKPKNSARSYYVLPKGSWTSLLAEFFWEHTKLPCCLAFKRAKVYEFGNSYITVDGRCSVCGSFFKGIISDKPSENSSVIMQCTFSGNFEIEHRKLKKRRLISPAIDKALMSILEDKISCETYRENEAVRLMNIGDY